MSKLLVLALLALASHFASAAQPQPDIADAESQFATKLHQRFPGTQTAVIAPAFPGFHYIVKESEVLFVRDDLSVLVPGDVIDLNTNRSMVAAIKAKHRRHIDVSKFNPEDAIHLGHGKQRLYVFSDPDCTFCRSLQPELDKLHDVEILVFPFPLEGIHPGARDAATAIWCQPDRAAAWDAYLVRHVTPPGSASCSTPIDRNTALATSIGVRATPSIVLPDGALIEGAERAELLQAQVAEASK